MGITLLSKHAQPGERIGMITFENDFLTVSTQTLDPAIPPRAAAQEQGVLKVIGSPIISFITARDPVLPKCLSTENYQLS